MNIAGNEQAARERCGWAGTPVSFYEPTVLSSPTVFSSPHSGRRYPASFSRRSRLDAVTLRASEDAFVDDLFKNVPTFGAPLVAGFCRSRCGASGRFRGSAHLRRQNHDERGASSNYCLSHALPQRDHNVFAPGQREVWHGISRRLSLYAI